MDFFKAMFYSFGGTEKNCENLIRIVSFKAQNLSWGPPEYEQECTQRHSIDDCVPSTF
jgi:hypothetical protein